MTAPKLLERGHVAIVAGAGPGIGRDLAVTLASHGAAVGLLARRSESFADIVDEIEGAGGRAMGVKCDITDPGRCDDAVARIGGELGPVTSLVCNASRLNDGTTVLDAEPRFENWRPYFEVVLFGALTIARSAVSAMREYNGGSIVMINSMVTDLNPSNLGAYPVAKNALESATQVLAREVGPFGIRVNGVHPGVTSGPTVDDVLIPTRMRESGKTEEAVREELEAANALRFLATGEDVAHAVSFLASDLARAITGQSIHVNAGGHFH